MALARSTGSATSLLCFFSVLLLLSSAPCPSHASLMGVDLGQGYIKVAVARPGKGLELVTNEQAKRKTPAAVGFTEEGERLFGDAAVAYAAKAPSRVILDGRSLIGQCDTSSSSSGQAEDEPFCPRFRQSVDGVGEFTGEEVVAMLLAMARRQASAFLNGAPIKDVAVTVPEWYDERQRLAITDAAKIIGLNCLGVVNANTAAAIKYALDGKAKPSEEAIEREKSKDKKKRAPKSIPQRILFFDVGAASASASVVEITSDAKTGIASSIRVLAHASDGGIGGRLLDTVVVERLADAFDKQRGPNATPSRSLPRVLTRLRKEAQRAREVLSANTETLVSVASLHDDMDLRTPLTRADFETDAGAMLRTVTRPVKAALAKAGLSAADMDAIVPFGGASRTPRIQDEVRDALGAVALNKSINTDEAAVMGSVFFAASMSSTFRVRKMDVDDVYTRGVSVEIEREGSGGLFSGSKKSFQTVEVFPDTGSKVPAKKTVSFNRNADFAMRIFLNIDKTGNARFPQRTLYAQVDVKGVADVVKKMQDQKKAKSTTPRVAISFHIDKSGLVRIGTAESSADETVVVEREVEVKDDNKKNAKDKKKKEGDDKKQDSGNEKTSSDSDGADASDAKTDGTGSDGSSDEEGKNKEGSSDDKENEDKEKKKDDKKEKKKTKIEKSTQTVVHRHTLTVEYVAGEGILGMQMSGQELESAQKVLKDLETADVDRVERADAFNSLEGFILEIRSKVRGLDEDDDLFQVSTEEERETLVSAFDDAEDWMYTAEAKQISNLRKKHHEMRSMFTPMETRAAELARRPKLISKLRSALTESVKRVGSLREAHASANSTHVEEFDKFPTFSNDIAKWLDEKEEEQRNSPLTEKPVISIKDIQDKSKDLVTEIARLSKLDIPVVPKVVPEKPEDQKADTDSEKNAEQGNSSTDTDANSTDDDTGQDNASPDDAELPPNPDAESAQADGGASSSKEDL